MLGNPKHTAPFPGIATNEGKTRDTALSIFSPETQDSDSESIPSRTSTKPTSLKPTPHADYESSSTRDEHMQDWRTQNKRKQNTSPHAQQRRSSRIRHQGQSRQKRSPNTSMMSVRTPPPNEDAKSPPMSPPRHHETDKSFNTPNQSTEIIFQNRNPNDDASEDLGSFFNSHDNDISAIGLSTEINLSTLQDAHKTRLDPTARAMTLITGGSANK